MLDAIVDGHFETVQRMDDAIEGLEDGLFDEAAQTQAIQQHTYRVRKELVELRRVVLSLQDTRLNTIMKKLTSWAAIIAVPTAVTGWFGQNVPYPGFQKLSGLIASAVIIVGVAGFLYAAFRRRGWL